MNWMEESLWLRKTTTRPLRNSSRPTFKTPETFTPGTGISRQRGRHEGNGVVHQGRRIQLASAAELRLHPPEGSENGSRQESLTGGTWGGQITPRGIRMKPF